GLLRGPWHGVGVPTVPPLTREASHDPLALPTTSRDWRSCAGRCPAPVRMETYHVPRPLETPVRPEVVRPQDARRSLPLLRPPAVRRPRPLGRPVRRLGADALRRRDGRPAQPACLGGTDRDGPGAGGPGVPGPVRPPLALDDQRRRAPTHAA